MAGVVGQAVHVVTGTGATEYLPAVQFVHVRSAVREQAAALLLVPTGHNVQGVQAVALAADQLTPAAHEEHLVFAVAEHAAARKLPAAHALEAHAEQGAYPVAEKVLPTTHAGTATHASAVAFQTKAGALHEQLVWPVSALLALYSGVVGHTRHSRPPAASLAVENWPAGHAVHVLSSV